MKSINKKRVVVTGVGVVTPIGINRNKFWTNLINGKSGCGPITLFDAKSSKCKIAAEIKEELPTLPPILDFDKHEKMSRATHFALVALAEALENSRINLEDFKDGTSGVILGSGISNSNFHPLYDIFFEKIFDGQSLSMEKLSNIIKKGSLSISELEPFTCGYNPAATIASKLEIRGMNRTISTACASGSQAIGEAFRKIRNGDLELIVTGGTDAMIDLEGFNLFSILKVLSKRNDEPEKASRPFDANRDGFVLGEGAGILILESMERALRRKATILGEIIGYGCTTDTYHVTTPEPTGTACMKAMNKALNDAEINSNSIDYINAHGTSTFYNDQIETLGIKKVFGPKAYSIPINSNKSMIGHLISAAGAVEFISSLFSARDNIVAPTINLDTSDPVCDLDYVPNKARNNRVDVMMSNSFGFGGQNVTIIGKKFIA